MGAGEGKKSATFWSVRRRGGPAAGGPAEEKKKITKMEKSKNHNKTNKIKNFFLKK